RDDRRALGRHGQLLAELGGAVGADPLREHAWAQLIVALYRSGARTEALAAYGRLRVMLIREYGMEPGPELEELHRQVLADDPALMIMNVPPPDETVAPAGVTKAATPLAPDPPADTPGAPAGSVPPAWREPAPADGQPLPIARD